MIDTLGQMATDPLPHITPTSPPHDPSSCADNHIDPEPEPISSTLPALPLDIYGHIIQYLAVPDLARCLRVSQALHHYAVRTLYHTVTISFDFIITGGMIQYCHQPGELSCIYLRRADETAGIILSVTGSGAVHDDAASLPDQQQQPQRCPHRGTLNNHLQSHTQHLIVGPISSPKQWEDFAPLYLPKLMNLHIGYTTAGSPSPRPFYPEPVRDSPYRFEPDSLLSAVRPRRLILESNRGGQLVETLLEAYLVSQLGLETDLSTLREIVLIADDYAKYKSTMGLSTVLKSLSSTIERLVFIMPSRAAVRQSLAGWWGVISNTPSAWGKQASSSSTRQGVALLCRGRALEIEIVGLETLGDVINEVSKERGRREVRAELKKLLLADGWAEGEANDRVDGLIFTAAA